MKIELKCVLSCYKEGQRGDVTPPAADCPVHGFERVQILLREQVEGDTNPCRYDHHGYCQEHGYFGDPGSCGVRDAREALGINA